MAARANGSSSWSGCASALCGAALAAACSVAQAGADQPHLHLMTENTPPHSMLEGGQVSGSSTEKVQAMMARTGTDYSLELLPWRRAYSVLQLRPDACLYSTTRTAEREKLFKWVGPTDQGEWVLLGRADRSYHLHSLEDARRLRIGTYHGDARDDYLRTRGYQVDAAPHDMINGRKLLAGRIDVWAAAMTRGSTKLEREGWDSKIVPLLTFNRIVVYLACNRAVPTELVARMNAALAAMERDGTSRRIDRKYAQWRAPQ